MGPTHDVATSRSPSERDPGQAQVHRKNVLGGAVDASGQGMASRRFSHSALWGRREAFQLTVPGPGATCTGRQERPWGWQTDPRISNGLQSCGWGGVVLGMPTAWKLGQESRGRAKAPVWVVQNCRSRAGSPYEERQCLAVRAWAGPCLLDRPVYTALPAWPVLQSTTHINSP